MRVAILFLSEGEVYEAIKTFNKTCCTSRAVRLPGPGDRGLLPLVCGMRSRGHPESRLTGLRALRHVLNDLRYEELERPREVFAIICEDLIEKRCYNHSLRADRLVPVSLFIYERRRHRALRAVRDDFFPGEEPGAGDARRLRLLESVRPAFKPDAGLSRHAAQQEHAPPPDRALLHLPARQIPQHLGAPGAGGLGGRLEPPLDLRPKS